MMKFLFTFCPVTHHNVFVHCEFSIKMNFMHTENRIIEHKYANSCGSTICPFQIQSLIFIICFQYLCVCQRNPQGLLLFVPDASHMRGSSCQIAHHAVEMATESDYTQHMVQRQTSANKDQGYCGRFSLVLMSQIILNTSPLEQMRVAINEFCIRPACPIHVYAL